MNQISPAQDPDMVYPMDTALWKTIRSAPLPLEVERMEGGKVITSIICDEAHRMELLGEVEGKAHPELRSWRILPQGGDATPPVVLR